MDDWGDDSTSGATSTNTNGFGARIGRGFGRGFTKTESTDSGGGFGRGRGNRGGQSNGWGNEPEVANTTNGFGSQGGGFGKNSDVTNNNDSGWGDGGTSGFGSKGFGNTGFGSKSGDSDAPRGGGFGRKGFGSSDGDKKDGCYKCGEDGHFARECPNSGGGGGGGSRACYKCGEEGHMSRECPSGGGGGGGSRACFKCGEEGHMSRECPNAESSGGGRGGDGKCFKCQEEGHFAKDCPNAEAAGDDKPREPNYVPPPPPEDEEDIFKSMQRGINFDKYDEIPVECSGNDAPKVGLRSFDEAELSETFRKNVQKARYEKPTPVQKWAIPIISAGRDLMACAQTGSGKTAAFLLPVLTGIVQSGGGTSEYAEVQTPLALCIGPTRELVIQIYTEARKFAYGSYIRPVVVYGGTSVQHQKTDVMKGAHLVVGTPGRLSDFIGRGLINLSKIKYLILDEADRMLDMGFEPEVRKIVETMGMPAKGDRQTLMFSATFPDQIQRLATDFLNNYLFVTVGRVGSANTDINQNVLQVTQFDKRDKLVDLLNQSGQDRVLVFVEQKRNADFLATYLSQSEFPTTSIHGDRLQREREEALADFKRGKAPVLVATSVAARGLDIPDVKHVVNYDMPSGIDEYVHRIGRTGRCGNLGKATSFFDPSKDGELARPLVKVLQDAQQEVPSWLEEAAESSFGVGFGGTGGKFGAKDTRRGKFGGGNDDFNSGGNSFGGGGFGSTAPADDDESWD